MPFTRVSQRKRDSGPDPRVFASLDELVRLQFRSSGFSFLPRQPVHSVLSGKHASRLRGRGLNFEELRAYLPSDDIRSIDWKVTARSSEPHVRVYTEERDRPVWLLVDQRRPMFFGSRLNMKSVTAAQAAAVSAWRVLAAGDRVGAIVFGEQGVDIVQPHRSRERVMQILRRVVDQNHALSSIETEPQASKPLLNDALRRLRPLAKHDCLVVVISDGYGSDETTTKHFAALAQHNDLLLALVHDPMESELPAAKRMVFAEAGRQLELDISSDALRAGWSAQFRSGLERIGSIARMHAVPLIPLSTDQDVLEQVRDQVGAHRQARRAR